MDFLDKLKQPENRRFEIKRSLPSRSQWLKTIISFVNGAGGELVIGVDDKTREVVGIEDPFELEEQITNSIYDSIRPTISPYIQCINLGNNQVLQVQILPGTQKPYYLQSKGIEKGTYIRVGSSNRQADLQTIEELKRQARGIFYLEQEYFRGNRRSLSKEVLHSFFSENLNIKKPSLEHFLQFRILKRNNGDVFPTFLGMLLFGKDDGYESKDFDYSKIKVTRYKGIDQEDILSTEHFGPPLALKINRIIDYSLSLLPGVQSLKGAKRVRLPLLPEFGLRESIINAIVHRDYSLCGASIQIDIFDDRCEIKSPGVLPGTLSIEMLGQGVSEVRNRNLVRIFRNSGFMEELGSGILRMIKEMKRLENPRPEFIEKGAFFYTILRIKSSIPAHLHEIYQLLRLKIQLSSSEVSKKLNIHQNTAIKKLNELTSLEVIVKNGSGRNTKYRIKV